ncbi:MAG TPA: hypothetical protein VNK43_04745 [Gemmatimonadales bacterium]|nr:hypothetical protein [Gemmatimonadales bacterium]
MPRLRSLALVALLATGCRNYDFQTPLASQGGLLPADQYAGYGREQAIAVAIGRQFGRPYNSGFGTQAEVAIAFARRFPDVVSIQADTLGHRLTVQFRSGWRVGIVPIDDGKSGADTRIPPS